MNNFLDKIFNAKYSFLKEKGFEPNIVMLGLEEQEYLEEYIKTIPWQIVDKQIYKSRNKICGLEIMKTQEESQIKVAYSIK